MESVKPDDASEDGASARSVQPPSDSADLEISTTGYKMHASGPGAVDTLRSIPTVLVVAPLLLSPILFAGLAAVSVGRGLIAFALCWLVSAVLSVVRWRMDKAAASADS